MSLQYTTTLTNQSAILSIQQKLLSLHGRLMQVQRSPCSESHLIGVSIDHNLFLRDSVSYITGNKTMLCFTLI